jgi:hypothetical protein
MGTFLKLLGLGFLLLVAYPIVGFVVVGVCDAVETPSPARAQALLAKVTPGMTPEEVEGVMGRPPEFTVRYAGPGSDECTGHNWTVGGVRAEVSFTNGRVEESHTFPPTPGPVTQFFGGLFFWWLRPVFAD